LIGGVPYNAKGVAHMLYLLRQGQTDWNLFHRANGVTETFLNQTGITQAEKAAKRLRGIPFDAVFASPQKRALQTCEIVWGGAITTDDRLREIVCGEFEGMEETPDRMQAFYRAIQAGDKGTEKMDNFMQKQFDFCDMLMHQYAGKNLLVVTHAANIRAIDFYRKGKPSGYNLFVTPIKNGEFCTYEI
jgi:probable phosphoglycerate mutase